MSIELIIGIIIFILGIPFTVLSLAYKFFYKPIKDKEKEFKKKFEERFNEKISNFKEASKIIDKEIIILGAFQSHVNYVIRNMLGYLFWESIAFIFLGLITTSYFLYPNDITAIITLFMFFPTVEIFYFILGDVRNLEKTNKKMTMLIDGDSIEKIFPKEKKVIWRLE